MTEQEKYEKARDEWCEDMAEFQDINGATGIISDSEYIMLVDTWDASRAYHLEEIENLTELLNEAKKVLDKG